MYLQQIKTFLTIKSIIRVNTFTKYKNSLNGINTHKYT